MNDILETLTIGGYAVEIFHDPDVVESPHIWCSSTLCTAHRRYSFGGERLSGDAGSSQTDYTVTYAPVRKQAVRRRARS